MPVTAPFGVSVTESPQKSVSPDTLSQPESHTVHEVAPYAHCSVTAFPSSQLSKPTSTVVSPQKSVSPEAVLQLPEQTEQAVWP